MIFLCNGAVTIYLSKNLNKQFLVSSFSFFKHFPFTNVLLQLSLFSNFSRRTSRAKAMKRVIASQNEDKKASTNEQNRRRITQTQGNTDALLSGDDNRQIKQPLYLY